MRRAVRLRQVDAAKRGLPEVEFGEETEKGCDPNKRDSDADGMPDNWEMQYSLNPTNSADNLTDLDNDGFSNLEEYLGIDKIPGNDDSTNPIDKSSHPPIETKVDNNEKSDLLLIYGLIIIILIVIILVIIFSIITLRRKKKNSLAQPIQTQQNKKSSSRQ